MLSKPMTAAERGELRKSIDSLVKDLDNLRAKLDQLPHSALTPPLLQSCTDWDSL
jgi:hypothetical protein